MSWEGDFVAGYAALVSTYVAFRWKIEERPYLTIYQPERMAPSDSIPLKIHNPGRRIIFIVGEHQALKASDGTHRLIRATPKGDPEAGISSEYGSQLMAGKLLLAIAPGGSAAINVGPMYAGIDLIFTFEWNRASRFDRFWPRRLSYFLNPLKIRITPELEALIAHSRTDLATRW